MDLVKLTETLIKELVNDPEEVSVKEFESDDENNIIIEVLVSEKELGKIIGRNGKTISAIKTIVQAKFNLGALDYLKNIKYMYELAENRLRGNIFGE